MAWLDFFSKLAPGLAALGAVLVARSGLNTWRRQLRGQAEYDLARRVLRALFKVRDEMSAVRAPMILGGEFLAAYKDAGEEPPANQVPAGDPKASELVYQRRWNRLTAALSELDVELLEAEVLWGPDVRAPETQLRRCVAELFSAVQMYHRMLATQNPQKSLTDVVQGQFRTLYRVHSDEDPDLFGARIDDAVRSFERLMRPHLGSRT